MRVHLHTLCWNEGRMLDFFFRHYEPWVDQFYILDDNSDDGTREALAARRDVVVANVERIDPDSWVLSARHTYNTAWKQSRGAADWVVITNIDEHLHHPNMRAYLEVMLAEGVTAIASPGYQMICKEFPDAESVLARDRRLGAPWPLYSRLGIFRPDAIGETNFSVGRHSAAFTGRVVLPKHDETANLHYKYLAPGDTHLRQQALGARLGPTDLANGWGLQYAWSREKLAAHFTVLGANLVDVAAVDQDQYAGPRWWR